ncbi:MAG: methyltransferase domain-containing protein [Thermoplasmata archaeon]
MEEKKPQRLNIGCGKDIKPRSEGWINLDCIPLPGVDVVWDIKKTPWPFKDNQFDFIYCSHILEHIPHYIGRDEDGLIIVMKEIYRVLKPGGKIEIKVPYYKDENAVKDPTHCRLFDIETFDYFTTSHWGNYYSGLNFKIVLKEFSKFRVKYKFLKIGKSRLGLFEHLWTRFPRLRPWIPKVPEEIHVVLMKQ